MLSWNSEDQNVAPIPEKHLPDANRSGGLCLCLSGGGFRATLFHLGVLRRLNELGLMGQLASVTSVSGGSYMSLCLAKAMIDAPLTNGNLSNFQEMVDQVHAITSYNLRKRIFIEKAEPTHWRTQFADLVVSELENRCTKKTLADLPTTPRFFFCATDMAFGVNWIYTHDRAGDYQAGYKTSLLDSISLAHATSASACFPPVFEPIPSGVPSADLEGGDATGPEADECRKDIHLSDGGVYDNMGLEPVWKSANTLLVSDAGGVFGYDSSNATLSDVERYSDILGNQARAVRKRWLISSFVAGSGPDRPGLEGTYWATSGVRTSYDPADTLGYSEAAAKLISNIRTDLDAFSVAEASILENHGYLMTDIAIRVHLPQLYDSAISMAPPYPEWMDESKVKEALKDSAKQHIL